MTPLQQQDYILNKMNEHQGSLQDKHAAIIQKLLEAEVKHDAVDRLSIVEALKDIQGRDSLASLYGISP